MATVIGKEMFTQVFADLGVDIREMTLVETAHGFDVMKKIEYLDAEIWKPGALAAIGENARTANGSRFTAFAIAMTDNMIVIKTINEIRHAPENGLPTLWVEALRKGWKIAPCPAWECGCTFVWKRPLPTGHHEVYGCLSHSDIQP